MKICNLFVYNRKITLTATVTEIKMLTLTFFSDKQSTLNVDCMKFNALGVSSSSH